MAIIVLSLSRSLALRLNYGAPMRLYRHLPQVASHLCSARQRFSLCIPESLIDTVLLQWHIPMGSMAHAMPSLQNHRFNYTGCCCCHSAAIQ